MAPRLQYFFGNLILVYCIPLQSVRRIYASFVPEWRRVRETCTRRSRLRLCSRTYAPFSVFSLRLFLPSTSCITDRPSHRVLRRPHIYVCTRSYDNALFKKLEHYVYRERKLFCIEAGKKNIISSLFFQLPWFTDISCVSHASKFKYTHTEFLRRSSIDDVRINMQMRISIKKNTYYIIFYLVRYAYEAQSVSFF